MRLVLLRHGVTAGADGRCMGHADLLLAEHGRAALTELAAAWRAAADAGRSAVPAPTRVVASDLARARDSAALVGGAFALPVALDPRLREMHFGTWDGRTWAELEREDGERLAAWMSDWAAAGTPGGEGFPDVARRAGAWLADLRRDAGPDETVLAVAHAGPIRALLCEAMGWPLSAAFRVRMDHARVAALRLPPLGTSDASAELLVLNADRVPQTPATV